MSQYNSGGSSAAAAAASGEEEDEDERENEEDEEEDEEGGARGSEVAASTRGRLTMRPCCTAKSISPRQEALRAGGLPSGTLPPRLTLRGDQAFRYPESLELHALASRRSR